MRRRHERTRAESGKRRANEIVFENRAVTVKFEDSGLGLSGLRKEVDPHRRALRIVEIRGSTGARAAAQTCSARVRSGRSLRSGASRSTNSRRVWTSFADGAHWRAPRADFDTLSTNGRVPSPRRSMKMPALVTARRPRIPQGSGDRRTETRRGASRSIRRASVTMPRRPMRTGVRGYLETADIDGSAANADGASDGAASESDLHGNRCRTARNCFRGVRGFRA